MPEFSYRGRNGEGLLVEGRVNASSVTLAAKQLQQDGLLVLNLQEEKAQRQSGNSIELFKPRIRTEEIILLSRQLMALSRAGVPIIRALNGLAESSANSEVKRVLQDISQTLIGGADLTSAFSRHPKVFSPIYLNMIHIGETTGKITEALAALVDHLERERDTRRKMKGALRYPIMVIGAISVALSV
ncbi:MAG: type II secretion system F family protein, partial [Oceanobacter sp.]